MDSFDTALPPMIFNNEKLREMYKTVELLRASGYDLRDRRYSALVRLLQSHPQAATFNEQQHGDQPSTEQHPTQNTSQHINPSLRNPYLQRASQQGDQTDDAEVPTSSTSPLTSFSSASPNDITYSNTHPPSSGPASESGVGLIIGTAPQSSGPNPIPVLPPPSSPQAPGGAPPPQSLTVSSRALGATAGGSNPSTIASVEPSEGTPTVGSEDQATEHEETSSSPTSFSVGATPHLIMNSSTNSLRNRADNGYSTLPELKPKTSGVPELLSRSRGVGGSGSTFSCVGLPSALTSDKYSPEPPLVLFTEQQLFQLKAQVLAMTYLNTNVTIQPNLIDAIRGKRSNQTNDKSAHIFEGHSLIETKEEILAESNTTLFGYNGHGQPQTQTRIQAQPQRYGEVFQSRGLREPDFLGDTFSCTTPESPPLSFCGDSPSTVLSEHDPEQRENLSLLARSRFDPQYLIEEREKRITTRITSRIQTLTKPDQSVQHQLENKALNLISLQKHVRNRVLEQYSYVETTQENKKRKLEMDPKRRVQDQQWEGGGDYQKPFQKSIETKQRDEIIVDNTYLSSNEGYLDRLLDQSNEYTKYLTNILPGSRACVDLPESFPQLQNGGFKWLISLYNQNINGFLVDEIGSEKTIQIIALVVYLVEKQNIKEPFLIVTSVSNICYWETDLAKWAPSIKTFIQKGDVDITLNDFNVVITTYESMREENPKILKATWKYIIIDGTYKCHSLIPILNKHYKCSTLRLIIANTPISNNLKELILLASFLAPKIFENVDIFGNPMEAFLSFLDRRTDHRVLQLTTCLINLLQNVQLVVQKSIDSRNPLPLHSVEVIKTQRHYSREFELDPNSHVQQSSIENGLQSIHTHPHDSASDDEDEDDDSQSKSSPKLPLVMPMTTRRRNPRHPSSSSIHHHHSNHHLNGNGHNTNNIITWNKPSTNFTAPILLPNHHGHGHGQGHMQTSTSTSSNSTPETDIGTLLATVQGERRSTRNIKRRSGGLEGVLSKLISVSEGAGSEAGLVFLHQPKNNEKPEYYSWLSQHKLSCPLDLRKIEAKLRQGLYPSPDLFRKDVDHLISCTLCFYPDHSSPTYLHSHHLQKVLEEEMEKAFLNSDSESDPNSSSSSSSPFVSSGGEAQQNGESESENEYPPPEPDDGVSPSSSPIFPAESLGPLPHNPSKKKSVRSRKRPISPEYLNDSIQKGSSSAEKTETQKKAARKRKHVE
eukprot:TRINITY_DN803_c0_g1_i1.p1 TRINITY_DN803_c0_g1~~TRINITY_DN803_c0_g1_i1.p1  ORF type:complete len:1313 (+),score=216.87 TRINITY_DN803_c0_g1_i1:278-3940(+)